jgi:plasmid stability protein
LPGNRNGGTHSPSKHPYLEINGNGATNLENAQARKLSENGLQPPPGPSLTSDSVHFAFVASSDSIASMATLTIRQLDQKTKTRLRVRAAHHGRSMEEEAREILRSALIASPPPKGNLADAIRRRFAAFGGFEVQSPQRDSVRDVPEFAE